MVDAQQLKASEVRAGDEIWMAAAWRRVQSVRTVTLYRVGPLGVKENQPMVGVLTTRAGSPAWREYLPDAPIMVRGR